MAGRTGKVGDVVTPGAATSTDREAGGNSRHFFMERTRLCGHAAGAEPVRRLRGGTDWSRVPRARLSKRLRMGVVPLGPFRIGRWARGLEGPLIWPGRTKAIILRKRITHGKHSDSAYRAARLTAFGRCTRPLAAILNRSRHTVEVSRVVAQLCPGGSRSACREVPIEWSATLVCSSK